MHEFKFIQSHKKNFLTHIKSLSALQKDFDMKLMCAIIVLINLFTGEKYVPSFNSINDYFEQSYSITVYKDGETTDHILGDDTYTNILKLLNDVCEGSREMPAYGVSLHEETRKEMQNGLWIELTFNKTETHNEMPFDSLLIKVEKEYQGFDLIRGQEGKYDGRCFHIYCPHKNTENLYNYLKKI